jgi:hypothetical protein
MNSNRRIPVSNGVLEGEHRRKIGAAIWEFLWAIDRTTEEYTTDAGDRHGKVLGGAVLTYRRIADECGSRSEWTTRANIRTLAEQGYLVIEHCQRGVRLEVAKAKKWLPKETDQPGRQDTASQEPAARQDTASQAIPDGQEIASQEPRAKPREAENCLPGRQDTASQAAVIRKESHEEGHESTPPLPPPYSATVVEAADSNGNGAAGNGAARGKPCFHRPRSLAAAVADEDYQILCDYYGARTTGARVSAFVGLLEEFPGLTVEQKRRAVTRARAKVAEYEPGANPISISPLRDQFVNEARPNFETARPSVARLQPQTAPWQGGPAIDAEAAKLFRQHRLH